MLKSIYDLFVKGTDEGKYLFTPVAYVVFVALIVLLLVTIAIHSKNSPKMKTKQMVFAAVAMALAMITSFIKFGSLPFGGSITLFSMFFICYIGYLYGVRIGIMTGVAYGILQLVTDPQVYHPVQLFLDYPFAYGCLGLSGLFYGMKIKVGNLKLNLIVGYLVGVFGRYVFHVISGYIFFRQYAKGNPVLYTLGYNATYIVPEAIATVVVLLIPSVAFAFDEVKKLALEA